MKNRRRSDSTSPARELLFEPRPCPCYAGLSLEGLTIEEVPGQPDRLHLILRVGTDRLLVGPDRPTVASRALLLSLALMRTDPSLPAGRASDILDWLLECWDETTEKVSADAPSVPRPRPWFLEPAHGAAGVPGSRRPPE